MEGRISAIRIKRSRMKEGTFFFFPVTKITDKCRPYKTMNYYRII